MKNLLDVVRLSSEFLRQKGVKNPLREAQDVISQALGMRRMDLYLDYERPLAEAELSILRNKILRRSKGEPCAYIHGEVEFHDCSIKVSSSVLIPRQETGILVDKMMQTMKGLDLTDKVLWDVCTGSGCMGIALKKRFPQLQVILSDLSAQALSMARENARKNEVSVEIVQGDLFQPFKGRSFDFLVCNPPYISEADYAVLDPEVRNYEPVLALVGGATGLEMYARLAKDMRMHAKPGSRVWFEIGDGQGVSLVELFKKEGWDRVHVENDWAGRERFFFLEIE
jgi:release factor glutamine methyltransferase